MMQRSGDFGAKGLCMHWQSYWQEKNLADIVRSIHMPQETVICFEGDDDREWTDVLTHGLQPLQSIIPGLRFE